MRILVAEDDAMQREVVDTHLRSWGYEPILCEDGAQARDALDVADPPNLLLLDWNMPFVDGLELCRKARGSEQTANAYVLIITSNDRPDDVVEALEAGADDFVAKPFRVQELRARVRVGARITELQRQALDAERNRVLMQTAGAAAHELSQPLSVILGVSQLLLRDPTLEGRARERAESICEQAKKSQVIMTRIAEVRQYTTRHYAGDTRIVDFRAGAKPESADPTMDTGKVE